MPLLYASSFILTFNAFLWLCLFLLAYGLVGGKLILTRITQLGVFVFMHDTRTPRPRQNTITYFLQLCAIFFLKENLPTKAFITVKMTGQKHGWCQKLGRIYIKETTRQNVIKVGLWTLLQFFLLQLSNKLAQLYESARHTRIQFPRFWYNSLSKIHPGILKCLKIPSKAKTDADGIQKALTLEWGHMRRIFRMSWTDSEFLRKKISSLLF